MTPFLGLPPSLFSLMSSHQPSFCLLQTFTGISRKQLRLNLHKTQHFCFSLGNHQICPISVKGIHVYTVAQIRNVFGSFPSSDLRADLVPSVTELKATHSIPESCRILPIQLSLKIHKEFFSSYLPLDTNICRCSNTFCKCAALAYNQRTSSIHLEAFLYALLIPNAM